MKLLVGLIFLGLVCGVTAEVQKETPKSEEITKSEKDKNLEISELPKEVQDSVKKECKGKVTSIKKIEVSKNIYFKVTAMMDGKATTYLFDDKGKMHNKS